MGAGSLFWLVGFFTPKEKILAEDYPRLILAGLFGAALNMILFYKGLSLTTPISEAVIMITTPMLVFFLSAIILKESIEWQKLVGIILGVFGAGLLIVWGKSFGAAATNAKLGNLLIFLNAIFYGLYLIVVKKLMDKYNPFTLIKWMYLVGLICSIPFGWNEFNQIDWQDMPADIYWKIAFIVLLSTFMTYALNLTAMKQLKPTTLSVFIYLQPLFATIYAISVGKDELSSIKIISAILIFTGVYLVSYKK